VTAASSASHGLSWLRLVLAPVVGALAAWCGIEVLATLHEVDVVALGGLLDPSPGVHAIRDPTHALIGLAVVFGFSERFLDQVAHLAEREVQPRGEDTAGDDATALVPAISDRSAL
jgi:hypothetical protein